MGIDLNKDMAVLKSYQGNYPILGRPGKILLSLSDDTKTIILPYLQRLDHCGFAFVATKGTAHFINQQGFSCSIVHYINNHKKIHDTPMHTITSIMKDPELVLVLNTPTNKSRSKSDGEIIRNTAISHGLPCFTREENIVAILQSIMASQGQTYTPFLLQSLKGNLNLGKKSLQEIAIELQ